MAVLHLSLGQSVVKETEVQAHTQNFDLSKIWAKIAPIVWRLF